MTGQLRTTMPVEAADFHVTGMTLQEIVVFVQELIETWGPQATVMERWHPFEEERYLSVMTSQLATERESQITNHSV